MELDSKKLVDEFLVFFQSHFSSIEIDKKPTPEFIAQHEHTFPEYLFYIWDKLGFSSFEHGGFWLVNPIEYEDILELCLKDTNFPEHDEFYVIGRSAFGELYAVGKNTRSKLTIDMVNLRIYPTLRDDENNSELALLRSLLSSITMEGSKKAIDIFDKNENLLFERCLTNLGELKENEIYAFEPPVVLGGPLVIENIRKVDLFQYIPFVAQLDKFQVMLDINKEVDRLGIKPRN
ncbi:GAD-like domain-containing protein [Acinetobacter sp.]|uniref:GAD-like domain-containing protein n=1 Tax=Acinetobacter sp. TaxID=472 RepID=UPI0035AE9768